MGRAPVWQLLIRFSGPTIVSMIVAASYNLVDAIFVGRLGPEALGALAIAFPIMLVFMAISMGTGVGATSCIARRLGAGDHEGATRAAGMAITLSILIGALMAAVCLPNLQGLLRLFGASGPVLPLATSYMFILAAFAVISSSSLIMGNIVRAEGRPMLSGAAMIASAVANIILDPILIFGLGPAPAMGVAGAAVATVIGRSLGVGIFLVSFVSGSTSYRFHVGAFLPDLRIIAEFYRVGFASIVRMSAMSLVITLANTIAASFGIIPLAVLGVVFRLARFAFQPTMGLGQGMLPLVGYNFGAHQKERIGEIIIKAGMSALGWGLLCWLIFMLFSSQIISIFNADPRFVAVGVTALRIVISLFFAVQLQTITGFFFQGIGKGIASLVLVSARQVLFLIPGLLVLPHLFGLRGLWAAFPVADALSILLTLVWTGVEFRRQGIRFRLRYGQPVARREHA
jgi:putative MATE family efflux protein